MWFGTIQKEPKLKTTGNKLKPFSSVAYVVVYHVIINLEGFLQCFLLCKVEGFALDWSRTVHGRYGYVAILYMRAVNTNCLLFVVFQAVSEMLRTKPEIQALN